VDTSGDQILITDVHLHATSGLTGGQMPTVDFRLLLQAVATPAGSPVAIDAGQDGAPAPADAAALAPAPSTVEETGAAGAAEPPAARAPRPRRVRQSATADPTPDPVGRARIRRAPATAKASPAGAKRGAASGTAKKRASKKATRKAAAPAETGGRVYRRMPDDFAAVYRQTSTPAAIADHYGVPRHTAQGWVRRHKTTNAGS
jgi:hypothetical protein